MPQTLPLWEMRLAVWDRLTSHAAMSAYAVRKEGTSVGYPFVDLGPVTVADRSTDSHPGVSLEVQVDAYALVSEGGGKTVSEIMDAVTEALSDGPLQPSGYEAADYLGLATGIISEDFDPEEGGSLMRGVCRYRFTIYQL